MATRSSHSLFLTLPNELFIQVYQAVDNFSTVAALAHTAKRLYLVWKENAGIICQAVAPRVFSNLNDLERLLDVQDEAESEPRHLSEYEKRETKSLKRAKRLLLNARCASAASEDWTNLCQIQEFPYRGEYPYNQGYEIPMQPSEKARFEHAFYTVWTIGIMATTPRLQDNAVKFLDECDVAELFGLEEFSEWSYNYNNNEFEHLGLDFKDDVWQTARKMVSDARSQHKVSTRGLPTHTPCYWFAFFDHTQYCFDGLVEE